LLEASVNYLFGISGLPRAPRSRRWGPFMSGCPQLVGTELRQLDIRSLPEEGVSAAPRRNWFTNASLFKLNRHQP